MESVVISCIDLLNSTNFPELIPLGTTASPLAKQSKACFSGLGHSCSQCQNWGSSILAAMSVHAITCTIPSRHVSLLPSHGLPKLCSKSCFNHCFQGQQFPLCKLDYCFLLGHSKTDLKEKVSVTWNSNHKCTHTHTHTPPHWVTQSRAVAGMGWWLDWMILLVFPTLTFLWVYDSHILKSSIFFPQFIRTFFPGALRRLQRMVVLTLLCPPRSGTFNALCDQGSS